MLTLTENASTMIKNLAEQTAVADNAGLRISAAADAAQLSVDLTPAPEPNDKVIESAGARVFLEENAALALDDKVLDAHMDEAGAVRFQVDAQESPQQNSQQSPQQNSQQSPQQNSQQSPQQN